MTDEKDQNQNQGSSGGKRKGSGKRRYFRRRRSKSKKTNEQTEQNASETTAKASKGESSGSGDRRRDSQRDKKRRPRRRRSSARRQRPQPQESAPEVVQDPESAYEEPTSVYVYTHVVRPAYRDTIGDYRPETSFAQLDEATALRSSALERLQEEIQEQLDQHFETPPDEDDRMTR